MHCIYVHVCSDCQLRISYEIAKVRMQKVECKNKLRMCVCYIPYSLELFERPKNYFHDGSR